MAWGLERSVDVQPSISHTCMEILRVEQGSIDACVTISWLHDGVSHARLDGGERAWLSNDVGLNVHQRRAQRSRRDPIFLFSRTVCSGEIWTIAWFSLTVRGSYDASLRPY